MFNIIYDFIFTIISTYILFKTIGYGLYEINNENNKSGGNTVIVFSILVTIFTNIIIWLK